MSDFSRPPGQDARMRLPEDWYTASDLRRLADECDELARALEPKEPAHG